jgi:hypothetical protein
MVWNGQTVHSAFTAPAFATAFLTFTPPSLRLIALQPGRRHDTTIRVTAVGSSFTVDGIASSNPIYDINPKSFTLNRGQSIDLTVSYTPIDSGYSWTRFDLQTDLCLQSTYASGGYPGYHPIRADQPRLRITSPNGGELLVAGTDTVITWSGIPNTDTVTLEYSIDSGSTWKTISTSATGGRFAWHVPRSPSSRCLVRVTQKPMEEEWTARAGYSLYESGHAVAVDPAGNVYITGEFDRVAMFGRDTLFGAGYYDLFTAKYSPAGKELWARRAGGTFKDAGYAIAVDTGGNSYVTGVHYDVNSSNDQDIYVAKYGPDGTVAWERVMGSTSGDFGLGIAVDAYGNSYVTGGFARTATFGGITLTARWGYEMFLAKYRPDGSVEWAKQFAGPGNDYGQAITVDANGDILVTGRFQDSIDFGNQVCRGTGGEDMFLARFQNDGTLSWALSEGGPGNQEGNGICLDNAGNILVSGSFWTMAVFNGDTLPGNSNSLLFVAKYTSDGRLIWVRGGSGNGRSHGFDVRTDSYGNIFVAGKYDGTAIFGRDTLVSTSIIRDYVACLYPDGRYNWIRSAGRSSLFGRNGLAVDTYGTFYLTGEFISQAEFGKTTLNTGGWDSDIFLWKYPGGDLHRDTSDNVFSIVTATPEIGDLDMGKVLVGTARDSVVRTYISNSKPYPVSVRQIQVPPSSPMYSIVSNFPPFDIPPFGSHMVEWRFRPQTVGIQPSAVVIITSSDTLVHSITGEGVLPTVALSPRTIDFGRVMLGSQKDTTITEAIRNAGNASVDFSGTFSLGPDTSQFSIVGNNVSFTLAPGESRTLTYRFAPRYTGRSSGGIGFPYDGVGSPAAFHLFGQGIGPVVRIADDSAFAGQTTDIAIRFDRTSGEAISYALLNFQARVAYDHSLLLPTGGAIQRGSGFDTLTVIGSAQNDSLVTHLPFVALLGDSEETTLEFVNFTWVSPEGARFDAETRSGRFRLLGICTNGGNRLLVDDGQVGILRINPNPVQGRAEIEIGTMESGRTRLTLLDMLGREVSNIADGEFAPGRHTLTIDTDRLSTGNYLLVLSTPTMRRTTTVSVVR